jgi:hypothetical protein
VWLSVAFSAASSVVVFGPFIAWQVHRDRARSGAWRDWAEAKGFEFEAAPNAWRRRGGDRVRGMVGGVEFHVELCTLRIGDSSRRFTRIVARGGDLVPAAVELRQRSRFERLNEVLGDDWIDFGAPYLPNVWFARGAQIDNALRAIDARFKRLLVACERVELVQLDGGRVEICLGGEIASTHLLERALDLACAAWPRTRETRASAAI